MAATKRKFMALTMKPELQDQVRAAAAKQDVTMTAWVRAAISKELERVAVGAYEDPPPHSPDQENLPQ